MPVAVTRRQGLVPQLNQAQAFALGQLAEREVAPAQNVMRRHVERQIRRQAQGTVFGWYRDDQSSTRLESADAAADEASDLGNVFRDLERTNDVIRGGRARSMLLDGFPPQIQTATPGISSDF